MLLFVVVSSFVFGVNVSLFVLCVFGVVVFFLVFLFLSLLVLESGFCMLLLGVLLFLNDCSWHVVCCVVERLLFF